MSIFENSRFAWSVGLRTLVYRCYCILVLGGCLLFSSSEAQAKWWKIFHHHHKPDVSEQAQPAAASSAPYLPAARVTTTMPAPAASPPAYNSNIGSNTSGQAIPPSLEPPPLPTRPPIPDPPQIACPTPLGSGVPKPALAWRAKSMRQLSYLATAAPAIAGTNTASSIVDPVAYSAVAKTLCVSKTFSTKFDDTFMATILGCSRSGLAIHSVDSSQGKLEAVSSDPHHQISVSVQVRHDLLDTTNVSCYCAADNTASKSLVSDLLSNIAICLGEHAK